MTNPPSPPGHAEFDVESASPTRRRIPRRLAGPMGVALVCLVMAVKAPAADFAFDLSACLGARPTPEDDPDHYPEPGDDSWQLQTSEVVWPLRSGLPSSVRLQDSRNNVSLALFEGRVFLALRTSAHHFASSRTALVVLSSADGRHWQDEGSFRFDRDLREPLLVALGGRLHLYFFLAGTNPFGFEPQRIRHVVRLGPAAWSDPHEVLSAGEVPWDFKVRGGRGWLTSYSGPHYRVFGPSEVAVHFRETTDGETFRPVDGVETVYRGGVSEVSFEFDSGGGLWAVTRNEDGDATGFGTHIVRAEAGRLGEWQFPARARPEIAMSPRLFRHGREIYLVARKNLGTQPFGSWSGDTFLAFARLGNWLRYSLTPKTTALYRLDQERRDLVEVRELPGAGDTAFPAIVRLDAHTFLLANYTSPLKHPRISWLRGQLGPTDIYLQLLRFVPAGKTGGTG